MSYREYRFFVTSGAIGQWFSRVTKSRMKIIVESLPSWQKIGIHGNKSLVKVIAQSLQSQISNHGNPYIVLFLTRILCQGSAFIKPDQLDPGIKDQIKITLLPTISHLQLLNFVSCGRVCPSHMTQNLVTIGANYGDSRVFPIWSLIRGSSWSGLIKAEPGGVHKPIKTIIDWLFRHFRQGWYFLTWHCDVTTVQFVTSRERYILALWRHIRWLFLHAQVGEKAITSE